MSSLQLDPSKVEELKKLIDSHLQRNNIYGQIRQIIQMSSDLQSTDTTDNDATTPEFDGQRSKTDPLSEDVVLQTLREKGIISSVLSSFRSSAALANVLRDETNEENENASSQQVAAVIPSTSLLTPSFTAPVNPSPSQRYLHIKILCGDSVFCHSGEEPTHFQLHLHFGRQRFSSRKITKSSESPTFNESFMVALPPSKNQTPTEAFNALLRLPVPLHLSLTESNPVRPNSPRLVGSTLLEWRNALSRTEVPYTKTAKLYNAELGKQNSERSTGNLQIHMDIVPSIAHPVAKKLAPHLGILGGKENNNNQGTSSGKVSISTLDASLVLSEALRKLRRDVENALQGQRALQTKRTRLFFDYSSAWWEEYLAIDPANLGRRFVKIMAEDEHGVHRLVTSFVQPLKGGDYIGRQLRSPRHAARFVSLLAQRRSLLIGNADGGDGDNSRPGSSGVGGIWWSLFAILTLGQASQADRANLLCSLLLGFGLDAYVVGGTQARAKRSTSILSASSTASRIDVGEIEHYWVMTRQKRVGHSKDIRFWEPSTGQVISLNDFDEDQQLAKSTRPFVTASSTSGGDHGGQCLQVPRPVPLLPNQWFLHGGRKLHAEERIESILRENITDYREQLRAYETGASSNTGTASAVQTGWDKQLAFALQSSLEAYEVERLTGLRNAFNGEFREIIKAYVPKGFTFKGWPLCIPLSCPSSGADGVQAITANVVETAAKRVFNILQATSGNAKQNPSSSVAILNTRGADVKFAVKCQIFTYAEGINSLTVPTVNTSSSQTSQPSPTSCILCCRGEATTVLETLHGSFVNISNILAHEETGHNVSFDRDKRVRRWCRKKSIPFLEKTQTGVTRGLKNRNHFTKYFNQYMNRPQYPTPTAEQLQQYLLSPSNLSIQRGTKMNGITLHCGILPPLLAGVHPGHHGDRPDRQLGGEWQALRYFREFMETRGQGYSKGISSPSSSWTSCSRLSPYFTWGHISLRRVLHRLKKRQEEERQKKKERQKQKNKERLTRKAVTETNTEIHEKTALGLGKTKRQEVSGGRESKKAKKRSKKVTDPDDWWLRSLAAFGSRLRWRSHFIQKFESECSMEHHAQCRAYDDLRCGLGEFDEEKYTRWATGRTGFPMVDACMRCLIRHGWLNFRMRAMLCSFAAYNLWLDWRKIAPHLARCFLDYEPGIHYPQLQMQSGVTGINAMRVYSVTKQAIDQDKYGVFIRKYVPELRQVPTKYIHAPYTMPRELRERLCPDYPDPIVDEKESAKVAKLKVMEIRRKKDTKREAKQVYLKHGSRRRGREKEAASAAQWNKQEHDKITNGSVKRRKRDDKKTSCLVTQENSQGEKKKSTMKQKTLFSFSGVATKVSSGKQTEDKTWTCPACTYINRRRNALVCEMCRTKKGGTTGKLSQMGEDDDAEVEVEMSL
eukprot:g1923.t1